MDVGGHLAWGVRDTFLDYVTAIEDHRIEVDGARFDSDGGQFVFPLGDAVTGPHESVVRASGGVTFWGHEGALDLTIADPTVVLNDDGATLQVKAAGTELVVARLLGRPPAVQHGSPWHWSGVEVALTAQGADLWGGVYGPWARMAPLDLVVPAWTQPTAGQRAALSPG